MGKLTTFLALDRRDRLWTIEALWSLALAQAMVCLVPPRNWRDRFDPLGGATATGSTAPALLEPIRRVRLAIARAARNIPTDPNCLPQALAARRMLLRRGIGSSLFIGVERDSDGPRRFHAWLKVGPEWVTGLCEEDRYSLLRPGDGARA